MKMTIAKNGLILEDGEGFLVYQQPPNEEDEVEAFANFLWAINEEYGPNTSRYSPKRVYIKVEPGDKFEEYHHDNAK